ncbi:MAG: hypothetical protein LQ337_002071 [Flavoplaca oasis]|nr:MAG: hypothetical protein LQ337_002071 [Flavoplaca oasis]
MLATLPPEILSKILEYVVNGDIPLNASKIIKEIPPDPRRDRVESPNITDWIIATFVSRQLRSLGRRAYLAQKPFIISPKLLNQFHKTCNLSSALHAFEYDNLILLFKHAQHIIAPLPGCSAASAFLTLPHYQANFPNLRQRKGYPCPEERTLIREPATEEIRGLLQGIGLDLGKLKVEILYSGKEGIRWEDVRQMRTSVFLFLRFVGQQRRRKYTNGRFLIDEKRQLAKRYLKFDLTNLCEEASHVTNGSTVQRVEKMEGGFSKALLMTMDNGKEVVAKLPCPNAGRAIYSTASEAAVLEYGLYVHHSHDCKSADIVVPVSTHTRLPTPKLLAWNANPVNPIGAEYIIMEKAPGVQLFTVWDDLSATDRLKLIKRTPEDHAILRDMALKLLPQLVEHPVLQQNARPVLWHTDLHMGNIFVSETDHSQIVSIIDWQHTSVSPHFLQARWPVFLSPPDSYALGPKHPQLPVDFENFDPHDKEVALFEKEKADASKAYEIATYLNNRATYNALWKFDEPTREFFRRIGDTWDDGVVPLQMCLQKICESWNQLGCSLPCPLDFTIRDTEIFSQRCKEYKQWYGIQDFAKKYLDTDEDGWIAPQMNFVEKTLQNKALLDLLVDRASTKEEARETRRMWPFPT